MALLSPFAVAPPPTSSSSSTSCGCSISISSPLLHLHHPCPQHHLYVARNPSLAPSKLFQPTNLGWPTKSRQQTIQLRSHGQLLVVFRGKRVLMQGTRERQVCCVCSCKKHAEDSEEEGKENQIKKDAENQQDAGVQLALTFLKFYKREISPFIPGSCRYVPTCSEYAMLAYKKYGLLKGSILTAWRLCRCNPFGGSGFDPPRWFGET